MKLKYAVGLILLSTLTAGCQTVARIAQNLDSLSEFQLPEASPLSEQGRLIKDDGNYSLGAVSSRRTIEKRAPDFWTEFFHALGEDSEDGEKDRSQIARYRLKDVIAVDGAPRYELTTDWTVSTDKDGNDNSAGLGDFTLRRLPDRKKVDLRRTEQIGLERLLEVELPRTIKVRYYFNDLERTGGWADVLRMPTGIAIKDPSGYRVIVDCRYEQRVYYAGNPLTEAEQVALVLGALFFDADQVKRQLVERMKRE